MPPSSFGKDALIVVSSESSGVTHAIIETIERLGGRIVHVYLPHILIGNLPLEIETKVRALTNVTAVYRGRVSLAEVEGLGPEACRAVKGWNRSFATSFRALKSDRSSEGKSWGAPGYAPEGPVQPPEGPDSPSGGRPAPGHDTSAYLIGKVAVNTILVEGTVPPYTFNQMERDTVTAEIQDGLGWLGSIEPKARVSWFHEQRQVTLDLDPARTPDFGEDTWRDACMASLGYAPSWQGMEQFVRERQAALSTDWSLVIFVTRFPLWHFAYAFKPRVVLSYDLDGWGVDDMDRVTAHEVCHIFGAGDEYAESKCDPSERFGYLQVENGNCELGTGNHQPCIMSHNTWAMCSYTRGQLGWRDANGDGVFDPLDAPIPLTAKPWWLRWCEFLRDWLGLTPRAG